jgi:hypothetical protein
MSRLDEELRNVMRREDPPDGFAARVTALAAQEKPNGWGGIFASRVLRWAMVGAVCLILAIAGIKYRMAREEQARGDAAKDQLMLALRIAGRKLQYAQSKIQQPPIPRTY